MRKVSLQAKIAKKNLFFVAYTKTLKNKNADIISAILKIIRTISSIEWG